MATGYSVVALALAHEQTVGKVLVAPPLRGNVRQPGVPTLVLTPANDRFCPPEVAEVVVRTFPDAELKVIENTDHFLNGHTTAVTVAALIWIDLLLG